MNKPTLFFSHSSKDKDMVLAIKNKVMQYTSGTLEIFQSSDGESIPFGTNWIHKVEEGLKEAKVMFVFVTEKSVASGWIYFEAGYAYSKGVHVIPVGVGVNVGDLKAPLNLLQGFNITSADSLNNFLTIINREFNYSFPAQFTPQDYDEVISISLPAEMGATHFDEIVRTIDYELLAEYSDGKGGTIKHDIAAYFDSIVKYLDDNAIPYSLTDPYRERYRKCLVVQGVKIIYDKSPDRSEDPYGRSKRTGKIAIHISPRNFEKAFSLYQNFAKYLNGITFFYVQLRLNDAFDFVKSEEDVAALLSDVPEWCCPDKTRVGLFTCDELNVKFRIFNKNALNRTEKADYLLHVAYEPKCVDANSITQLIERLYGLNLIYKKVGDANNA